MSRPPFSRRLAAAWAALCGADREVALRSTNHAAESKSGPSDDALLDARAEAARFRLIAEESARTAEALRRELEAERTQRTDAIGAALAAKLEIPLTDAAATLGQLALQARLIEEGKPVTARDVMALTQNLNRSFTSLGLQAAAVVGEAAAFDPALHQPLGGPALADGSPVVVRIPGYRLRERLLRKSFVEPATCVS